MIKNAAVETIVNETLHDFMGKTGAVRNDVPSAVVASRMMRFFVLLVLFGFVVGYTHAIHDPRDATTKPPKRREPVLPWYSSDKDDIDSDEDPSRSPQWRPDPDDPIPKKPYVVDAGTKSWTSWRKEPGSEIEQRTEIGDDRQSTTNFDQTPDFPLEYSQFEQQENQRFPSRPSASHKQKDKWMKSKQHEERDTQSEIKNDRELYEGIPPDSMKPRKEEILLPKPKSTIARYDHKNGVQCPDFDSTGQFVYPPDCKFFVNCWKGRAFVQPCAPGTLFNPDTLECDFPHKVKCYGGEVAGFPSSRRREPIVSTDAHSLLKNEQGHEPRCPPQITGMLPHPTNCTKFLQCANGGTYIMDCAPGTVFNPAISVCDWPYRVKGCEDALKPKEETTPSYPPDYDDDCEVEQLDYNNNHPVKKISCPPDHTGLLPHPETCKKFLQCANGITYIMDCGPGTAFNPLTSVCDWPYNVPGCSEEKPVATTSVPWSHNSPHSKKPCKPKGVEKPSQPTHPVTTITEITQGSFAPNTWTTSSPRGTSWDDLRPTWRPSFRPTAWTTAAPPVSQTHHHNHYHHHNSHTGGGRESNYGHSGHEDWNQTPQQSHPQTQWPHRHGTTDPNYNPGYYHHHHHDHHYYSHGPTYDPNRDAGTQESSHPDTQTPDQESPHRNWNPTWRQGHHRGHHNHRPTSDRTHHREIEDDIDEEEGQVPFDEEQVPFYEEQDHRGDTPGEVDDMSNVQQNVPPNRRIDGGHTLNWQEYGRTNPGFSQPDSNREPRPGENIYVDENYQEPRLVWNGATTENKNRTRSNWTRSRFVPSSWNQQRPEPAVTQAPSRKWDQGVDREDEKFHDWGSRTNIYQGTTDREADTKLDQWASRTNVKGRYRPSPKNVSTSSLKPHYPTGIYVNINGTRGHFITKEIEVNQGHSRTNTYRPNAIPSINESHKNDQNTYIDSQLPLDQLPSMTSHSLRHVPDNRSFEFNDTLRHRNVSVYRQVYRNPKQYSTNVPSNNSFEDLVDSGTTYNRVPVPSTNLQPPPFSSPNRSPIPLPHINSSRADTYYPPLPATNLVPPHYKPHRSNSTTNWQYPPEPATELQPPPYVPQNNFSDFTNFTLLNVDQELITTTTSQPPEQVLTPAVPINRQPKVPINNPHPSYRQNSSPSTLNTSTILRNARVPPKKVHRSKDDNKPVNETSTTMNPNVPVVYIDEENSSTEEPEDAHLDQVDVLVDKKIWKPVLVFDNKSQTTTESSHIMRINKKKVDVDLYNIEAPPYEEEEPPFPSYYVPPVEPLDHSKKVTVPTPISGQVIRLRGGSGPHDGYVEVQGMNPGWGVVCDSRNSWTLREAHVVCKQLGYTRGAEMAWQGRTNRNNAPTWIAANSVSCQGDEAKFQSCKFTHEPECRVERDAIGVRCAPNRVAHCRKDELPYEGQCYHLADPDSGLNHQEASDYCTQRQARLIDITNQAENDFISEWLVQIHPEVGSIMTSGVGFTTMNRTIWLWEDSSRAKFKFTKWWPGWLEDKKHPPIVGARVLCLVMKRKFPCHERPDSICVADYFFWDAEDCASSSKGHSYICKRPYDDIGCIYGKGSQYAGNANVTASGRDCLPWNDPKVAHPLTVIVVNQQMREKLKTHNYCRNPNPNRETRPWCFTGANGEREHCDIPSCGNIGSPRSRISSQCNPKHFECLPGECIPSPWVCDGEEDCTNGADEAACVAQMDLFQKHPKYKLEGHDIQKWLNTPLKNCALRCKEADFTCRSFTHKAAENICLLSDSNIGMTGALKPNKEYDYYEMRERSMNCKGMYVCENKKCINQSKVCNGKNDCGDRSDESVCTAENLDYAIRLAGSDNDYEGRIEVKILGVWGQVCDDGFGMIDADVICKELGFTLGALEIRPGGFYGNLDPPTRFMVDQLRCRGNETTLRECDFDGWGVHNCQPEEAVGVVCKTAVDTCPEGHWKCDESSMCIPTAFICDTVVDCPDGSDENSQHCDAPFEIRLANGSSRLEGRVEVRHHGIWGTVCDDDFSNAAAAVICRSLGYGGRAIAKKDGFFGPGEGPIWLDEVFCNGNETQLYRCDHNHWGQHNCNHDEDAGVICTPGDVNDSELYWNNVPAVPETNINDILPSDCGKRLKDFDNDDDLILERVVRGSVAPKGSYPWQASIRVRGHSRSNHWCGAAILSPLHVLTAAHCLQGYNKGTYFVRAGDYNTEIDEGTEIEANIEDYYIHEEFRKGHVMNNDIAVVLLKGRGIPLGRNIMPICLPSENVEYPAGLNCTISGFGSVEAGTSIHSKDLRYGWIPLLDQSVCRAGHIYGEGGISDGMFCAGYLDEGVDTCEGDSGGPLACYHNGAFTLYGITSWGKHCGKANKPGVYVRISHYRRWIDQKIKESMSGR